MQTLPIEVSENILFSAGPRSVRGLCQTNSSFHNICLDERFWRRKLSREGVIIPDETFNFPSWLNYYENIDFYLQDFINNLKPRQMIFTLPLKDIFPLSLWRKVRINFEKFKKTGDKEIIKPYLDYISKLLPSGFSLTPLDILVMWRNNIKPPRFGYQEIQYIEIYTDDRGNIIYTLRDYSAPRRISDIENNKEFLSPWQLYIFLQKKSRILEELISSVDINSGIILLQERF